MDRNGWVLASVLAIVAVILIVIAFYSVEESDIPSSNQTDGKLVPNYCTVESREVEFCTKEYRPVCGWYDPAEVQCISYPCAITVGNQCEACQDSRILYYTDGECPTPNAPA